MDSAAVDPHLMGLRSMWRLAPKTHTHTYTRPCSSTAEHRAVVDERLGWRESCCSSAKIMASRGQNEVEHFDVHGTRYQGSFVNLWAFELLNRKIPNLQCIGEGVGGE